MDAELTEQEKQVLSDLYQATLMQQQRRNSSSSREDIDEEFVPFLLKEGATWAEYAYVTDCLTKNRVEFIQGRIFVQATSTLHEAVNIEMGTAIQKAIAEQSQELESFVRSRGAPSTRWRDNSNRQPDGSFTIKTQEVCRQFCLIIEVNCRGLTATKFLEKLQRWITETDEVMVVIGLDVKPNRQMQLFAIHVYQYTRSPDGHSAVSKYMDDSGQTTFQRTPPNMTITIDLGVMFRHFSALYTRLLHAGYIQTELVISLNDVWSSALSEYQDLRFLSNR